MSDIFPTSYSGFEKTSAPRDGEMGFDEVWKAHGIIVSPLHWSIGWPRTDDPEHSRFDTSPTKARDKLTREVALMGGRNWLISSNARTNRYGEILSRQSRIEGTGVAAYFDLNGKRVCIPCDRWIRLKDNVNAIALMIGALRGLERWGASRWSTRRSGGLRRCLHVMRRCGGKCWASTRR